MELKSMRFGFVILFLLTFLFSCSSKSGKSSFYSQLKTLEIERSTDSTKWQSLFNRAQQNEQKLDFIFAVAHTKESGLFPLMKKLFLQAQSDTAKILAAFALAQLNHPNSESTLLKALMDKSVSLKVKKAIIRFLPACATNRSWNYLKSLSSNPNLKENIFFTLGILNKKWHYPAKFDLLDSTKKSLTVAESYFLLHTPLTKDDLLRLIPLISRSKPAAQIYLFQILKNNINNKTDLSTLDSLHYFLLLNFLKKVFKDQHQNWHLLLSALPVVPFVNDSTLIDQLKSLNNYPIPHVRLASYQSLIEILGKSFIPDIIESVNKLHNNYEKAYLIHLIAQVDPSTAYLLINNNLDKGNPYFKALLLKALAKTKLSLSKALLQEFLKIDDPILTSSAFLALTQLKPINDHEINLLLNSKHVSNVGTVLEWALKEHRSLSPIQLFNIYKKFNNSSGIEIQMSILHFLEKYNRQQEIGVDSLLTYLSHPVLLKMFPKIFGVLPQKTISLTKSLPDFLQPDSLTFKKWPSTIKMETTRGTITLLLEPQIAPITVKNFLHLAKHNFFNNTYFHRVIADFVVQGGDPTGTGWAGPGYLIPSEHSPKPFVRGSVGMATAGFDTGGSQFFICLSDQPHLNGNYIRFAKVIKGMKVVDQILQGDKILSVKIIE